MDRLLRLWFQFREIVGRPKVLTAEEFEKTSGTVLVAGSPWVTVLPSMASNGTMLITTNTTWASGIRHETD